MSAARKKIEFEEALEQLERIAEEIEQGRIGLEESITKYEAGMSLIAHCRTILDQSELKIQKLQARADAAQSANDSRPPRTEEP